MVGGVPGQIDQDVDLVLADQRGELVVPQLGRVAPAVGVVPEPRSDPPPGLQV